MPILRRPPQDPQERTIWGWALYDWANSAYAITAGALIAPFFTGEVVPEEGFWGMSAETLWAFLVSVGTLILFLGMPVLGAIADFTASKSRYLRTFIYWGALSTIILAWLPTGQVVPYLIFFMLTQIGFAAANVFYDGFLPEITTPDNIDRVSSRGFALGYMGGGLYLCLVLLTLVVTEVWWGWDRTTTVRMGILGAGVWWLGFGRWSVSFLNDRRLPRSLPSGAQTQGGWWYVQAGFSRTWKTLTKLRQFPYLLGFVVAFLLYNDGVQTVINISPAYAEQTLELSTVVIGVGFLTVQVVAFFGSLLFGWLAGRRDTKTAILISLGCWVLVTLSAFWVPTGSPGWFVLLAGGVGLVLGATQALSRSLYGSMIPVTATAEFYGFYSVFSKFSAIWGPALFGLVSHLSGSGRPAILSLVVFFILGGIILWLVPIEKARESRHRWTELGYID